MYNLSVRIGIDPLGGTNPNAPGVVWTPWSVNFDRWHPLWVRATAQSNYVTVFLQGHAESPAEWNIYAFDNALLTERAQRFNVRGKVTLGDFVASPEGFPVEAQLRPTGSAEPLRTEILTLDAVGNYTLTDVEPGQYDIAFKANHWLRAVVRGVQVTNADVQGVDVLLVNGDIDGDNDTSPCLCSLGSFQHEGRKRLYSEHGFEDFNPFVVFILLRRK